MRFGISNALRANNGGVVGQIAVGKHSDGWAGIPWTPTPNCSIRHFFVSMNFSRRSNRRLI
jgi:hypothetical protein